MTTIVIRRQGDTRSEFIRQALQSFVEQKENEEKEKEKREGMLKAALEIKLTSTSTGKIRSLVRVDWRSSPLR